MNTILNVTIKNNYGRDLVYPACDLSRKFAKLVDRATLTAHDIEHIKSLGYTFNILVTKVL